MGEVVIDVENLSKQYRLGVFGHGSLYKDLQSWWAKKRGREDPNTRIGSDMSVGSSESIWALKDVSFQVEKGEVLGIIGANGAGKSTLLKILSRVTAPTEGNVKVKGRVASLLEVGTGFHPELTGRENVYLNGTILGMKKAEIDQKFDDIMKFAEIEKFIDTPVKRYSSGMYVRLAFAVAAHLDPEILVVDEVLAVGDAAFQKKCIGKMGEVAKEGRTVLFVSHNMGAVQKLCMKGMFLKNGMVGGLGSVEDMIDMYMSDIMKREHTDVQSIERGGGLGEKVRICSVSVLNSKHDEVKELQFGEPFTLKVGCIGIEKVSDIDFDVSIHTSYDLKIVALIGNESFDVSSGDKVTGYVDVNPLVLSPGNYSIRVALRQSNRWMLDSLSNVLQFTVSNTSWDKSFNAHGDSVANKGIIQLPKQIWTISKTTIAETGQQ